MYIVIILQVINLFVFQRIMAESNPSNTQPEKAESTDRLTKVKFHFKHDNGIDYIIIPLSINLIIYYNILLLFFKDTFDGTDYNTNNTSQIPCKF